MDLVNDLIGRIKEILGKGRKLDKKKKLKLIIGVANACLLVILLSYWLNLGSRKNEVVSTPVSKEISVEESNNKADKAMLDASGSMNNVYYNLIQGTTGKLNDYNMHFDWGGEYNGFFDSNNTNVSGYKYTVTELADGDSNRNVNYVANLNIYNKDMSVSVQYKIVFDSSASDFPILLYYPSAKLYIALSEV